MQALAAREHRGAGRCPALPQVVERRFGIVEIDPAGLDPGLWLDRDRLPVAAVGNALDRERLQSATRREVALLVRDEAVEQAVVLVFGLVDDAAVGVDRGSLVIEAASSP